MNTPLPTSRALMMAASRGLFGPNIHSRYEIGWNEISPERADEIRTLLLRHYPYDDARGIRQVDEWERMSNNFRMRVSRGGRTEEVLLRKHIQLRDEASVLFVGRVLDYLRRQGIRVPEIIPARDGTPVVWADGHYYQLYTFIPGTHFRGTRIELKTAAREIARLHIALAGIPFFEEIATKPKTLPPWERDGWVELLDEAARRSGPLDRAIARERDFILRESDLVLRALSAAPAVKIQVIRNSLHPQDTLFENEILNAFIDFEDVNVGELIRDVANSCHRFVRQYVVYQGSGVERTLPEGISLFLQTYQREHPLDERELRLAPIYIRDDLLRKLYKGIGMYYRENWPGHIENGELEKKLNLLREAGVIASLWEEIV